jgi:ASC-1-like (ASCH) protein
VHHLAIMNPRWGLLPKILSGEKTLESRWYKNRSRPWGNISSGDTVFFKDSSQPVTLRATVAKVKQFSHLTPHIVRHLLTRYAQKDGLGIDPRKIETFYQLFKGKKYCLIIHLKNPRSVKPFNINKQGFGAMSAWITVKNINQIKKQL